MKKSKWKRLLSSLLTAAMLAGCIPASASASTVSAAAAETNEARIIDRSTYEKLGFNLDLSTTDESFLGPGNTTLNTKNELYLNYNGSSNYGWMLRDNLDFNHENWTNYKTIGAYKLYGQYRNGDWAHLNDDNGYTYGQTGGQESVIGSDIHSENTHQNRAYETSTEYRSASGRLDRVAQIYVVAGKERKDYKVSLELLKFVKDSSGKYVEQTLKYTTLSNSIPALDETGCFYNQSYDALFDITAGDFNGDGVDEVAVYYGTNEVKIYKTSGDKLTLWQTIEADDILKDKKITEKKNADSTEGGVQRAAIVTLAAGDLKKDYSEDLVITVSMPQGATESAHKNNPYTYIFGNSDGGYLSKDEEIALKGDYQGTPQVFKAANAAIGDLDGDSSVELVIGGRLCPESGVNDCGWNQGRLIYVKYNHGTKKYDIDYSNSIELKEQDGTNVLTKAHNDDVQYFAPVGMAVADLDGTGEQQPYLLFFAELFTYSSETGFTATGNVMDTIRKQKNNADESEDKTQHWVSDVVVGNFNNNDKMAQQIVAIVACKQSGDDSYWYYMSYIAMNDSGKICAQSEGILNQAGGYLNQSEKKRAAPYVSIACPDVDEDSILMEFAGAKSYYSKPEVFSVLQSAPYFEDVNEVYDNYLNNGATAFGTVSGVSNGATSSIETKLGIYAETEVSLFASTGMEMDISVKTSYDHTSSWNNTTSIEYAGSVGDDYVVMYTIPYHRYYYNATYEDGKKDIITIEEPLTPSTVIVPVEVYDEIAAETEGIEPIRYAAIY